jgi:hypothetical protein
MNFDIDLDENKEIKIKKQERQRKGIYFTVLLSIFIIFLIVYLQNINCNLLIS